MQPTPPSAPYQETPDSGSGASRRSSLMVAAQTSQQQAIPLLIVFSATLMVQAATDCSKLDYCQKEYGFAVAVGTISLFCAIVFAILERTNLPIAQKMAMPLSIFLYFFNTVGACVFTFDLPYPYTGNGYFASWGAAFMSLAFAYKSIAQVGQTADQLQAALLGQPVAGIFLASVIQMIAAANVCSNRDYCKEEFGYQVAVGTISTMITLVLLILPRFGMLSHMPFMKWIALFLVVWWIPGVYVSTFEGDGLTITGNGYFAAWGALFCSVRYCQALFDAEGGFAMPKMSMRGGHPQVNGESADNAAAKMEEGAGAGANAGAEQPPVAMAVAVPVEDNPGVAHQRGDSASAI